MAGLSYGFIETRGLICAIESADAMVKAARVRLIKQHNPGRALVTVICEGDLAACQAAIDAGSAAAMRFGELISAHVIPRPDGDTDYLVEELISKKRKGKGQGKGRRKGKGGQNRAEQPPAKTPPPEKTKSAGPDLSGRALRHLRAHPAGATADELAAALKCDRPAILTALKALLDEGVIEKMQRKYYPLTDKK